MQKKIEHLCYPCQKIMGDHKNGRAGAKLGASVPPWPGSKTTTL